jgi:hypothetical protein
MCIACELGFWNMVDALTPEVRERILREQEGSQRFACEAPADQPVAPPVQDEHEP